MKRMMEKGKGKRRTLMKCRANKKQRFAAQSTREAEETKADHRNIVAAQGGSTSATCPWLLLSHAVSAQVSVCVWNELLGCAEAELATGWDCGAESEQGCLLHDHGRHSLERRQSLRGNGYHRGMIGDCWHHYVGEIEVG